MNKNSSKHKKTLVGTSPMVTSTVNKTLASALEDPSAHSKVTSDGTKNSSNKPWNNFLKNSNYSLVVCLAPSQVSSTVSAILSVLPEAESKKCSLVDSFLLDLVQPQESSVVLETSSELLESNSSLKPLKNNN